MATLASLVVKIAADTSALVKGLDEAQSRIDRAFAPAMAGSKMLLGGVMALAGGFAAAGGAGIKLAADMEQSRIAFTTMLGDAEKADRFLRDLWGFAAKTPFEFEGLQQASRQLLAFGFRAEQIIPMMTAIGNAVAGLGGGAFEIERVTRALGQMQAKGKVSAQEMMQLAEVGIPAWELLAKAIGTDIPTAMKRAETQGIPAALAIEALVAGMNERFPDMMAKQSGTLLGLWSTAKDNISGILRVLGEEIITTFDLKSKLAGAIEAIGRLTTLLQEEGLRGALAKIFPPDRQRTIVMIAGAILGGLIPALYGLATAFIAATLPLAPFMVAGAAVAGLAFLIIRNWEPLRETFSKLWEDILRIFRVAKDVVVRVIDAVSEPIRALIELIQRALNWLDRLFGATAKGPKLGPALPPAPPGAIPRLAHGAVVTRPTLAVVGERGPEAVVPLNRAEGLRAVDIGSIQISIYEATDPQKVARLVQRTVTDTVRRLVLEGA